MAQRAYADPESSIYQPLPSSTSIRVLTYSGRLGWARKTLVCVLTVIELGSAGRRDVYDALSYVWGSSEDPAIICCNGLRCTIRRNLHAALTNIWAVRPTTMIWADALCINQVDLAERSAQVGMMHRIYAQASDVLAWLGEPVANTKLVFKSLEIIDQGCAGGSKGRIARFVVRPRRQQDSTPDLNSVWARIFPSELWEVSRVLFNNTWFSRVWTLQEIAVNDRAQIVCGRHWMSWHVFKAASFSFIKFVKEKIEADFKGGSLLDVTGLTMIDEALNSAIPSSLRFEHLLLTTRNRHATERRDRIYALLNILDTHEQPEISIDYTDSLEHVLADTTRACIKLSNQLDVLRMAGLTVSCRGLLSSPIVRPDYHIATWVVDWLDASLFEEYQYLKYQPRKVIYELNAIYARGPCLKPVTDRLGLQLRGLLLAVIQWIPDDQNVAFHTIKEVIHDHMAHSITLTPGDCSIKVRAFFDFQNKTAQLPLGSLPKASTRMVNSFGKEQNWEAGDALIALFGSADLYLVRKLDVPIEDEAEVFCQLVGAMSEAFTNTAGVECLRMFRHFETDFHIC